LECEPLTAHAEKARDSGWRTLIVAHSRDPARAARLLAGLSSGDCLLVAPKDLRGAGCSLEASPMDIDEVLGTEHQAAIIASRGLLRPNIIAAAGETVKAGGFLALAVPPRDEWDPGPPGGPGRYKAYLESMIPTARSHIWVDLDACEVYSRRDPEGRPGPPRSPSGFKSRKGVPRALIRLARTWSQAEALEAGANWLRGRHRTLMVEGDRGRGKSYASGLILALAAYWHSIGRAEVTAPSLAQAQQVFRGLLAGLEALGLLRARGMRVVESGGRVVRVSAPWFRVSYEEPGRSRGAPLMVIDEAAALGVARVRRLSWRSGKVLLSTTIHGYEGSGRTLATMIEEIAPRPLLRARLREPVRYYPGDPLEEWLYRVFMLDVEPEGPRRVPERLVHEVIGQDRLARDPGLLRRVYGVLALAHYRAQPDDILALLDSPGRWVHALTAEDGPVAVALLVDEGVEGADLATSRLRLVLPEEEPPRAVRVQRIAVLPWLQRRGLGSRLLSHAEAWAAREGFEAVLTIFSRPGIAGFWAGNGYLYYYISPRYNKVTGEKNMAAGKPLTPRASPILWEASGRLRARLVWTLPSIYRDLAAETVATILPATGSPVEPSTGPPPSYMAGRLEACVGGEVDAEQAWDPLVIGAKCLVERRGLDWIPEKLRVFLVARVLQGKPLDEAAEIAGVPLGEAVKVQAEACRIVAEALGDSCSKG